MYSRIEDYLARWIGVTVLAALVLAWPWVLLGWAESGAADAGLVVVSMAVGTLHIVWVACKRRAGRQNGESGQSP